MHFISELIVKKIDVQCQQLLNHIKKDEFRKVQLWCSTIGTVRFPCQQKTTEYFEVHLYRHIGDKHCCGLLFMYHSVSTWY